MGVKAPLEFEDGLDVGERERELEDAVFRQLQLMAMLKYSADQPRIPKGMPGGGKWLRVGGGRVADLPEKPRARVEAWGENHRFDRQGVVDSAKMALRDPVARKRGESWYREEFGGRVQALADELDEPFEKVAAVVAITSAQSRWEVTGNDGERKFPNLETTERFFRMHHEGAFDDVRTPEQAMEVSTGYIMQKGFGWNAIQLLRGDLSTDEAVTGPKRRSFYDNGVFPEDSRAVTNDTWMGELLVQNSDLTYSNVQSSLATPPGKYLRDAGVYAGPAYLLLADAVAQATDEAIAEGLVPEGWLPHQTQAAMWVHLGGGRGGAVGGRGAR